MTAKLPASEYWFEAGVRYAAMLEAETMYCWAKNNSMQDIVGNIAKQSASAAQWFEVGFFFVTAVRLLTQGPRQMKWSVIESMQSELAAVNLPADELSQIRQRLKRLRKDAAHNNDDDARLIFELIRHSACRMAS